MMKINFELLKKPNLWSYASLRGRNIMMDKAEGKKVSEDKKEALEYIIKKADLPINEVNQMLREIKEALLACNYNVKQVKIRALSRVLVGSSETFGEIPFEVGVYFDPIINSPYMPGSTIKGAVRSATFNLLYRGKFEENKRRMDIENARRAAENFAEENCRRIFGGLLGKDQSAGLVGFTDAYPIRKGDHGLLFYPDVITPHYKDDVRTELEVKPIPIIYLTIAPGTEFQFFMFYKRRRGIRELTNNDLLDLPTRWQMGIVDRGLLYAFIRGVGAKTALGYSRFEILSYEEVS